jgi:hypothetical protein
MLDRIGQWATALDAAGSVSLPVWGVVAGVVFVVLLCGLALLRTSPEGKSASMLSLLLISALAGWWWGRDYMIGRDRAAEQRALDARAFELATRAFTPGSALGCLDAIAGETVAGACEKALFATPEATAAAVSYVAAQLSLLASARELADGEANPAVLVLRRAVEADRFGIAAHVLAVRDGCTPDQCSAFVWLRDPGSIKVNLAERTFDARLKTYSASWPAAGTRGVASNVTSPPPGAAAKVPSNLYFPSASSIPPVNIMTAEPPAARRQPQDTTGPAESVPPMPPRRPPQADSQAHRSPIAAPARPGPTPLAPAQ